MQAALAYARLLNMQDAQTTATKAIRLQLAAIDKPQAWLAAEVGETPFWLSRRMSGKKVWDVMDLESVAQVFGLNYLELLASADAIPTREAVA